MNAGRYNELTQNDELKLTEEEKAQGWHFCRDWDFMLIHKDHPEIEVCLCNRNKALLCIR